MKTIELALLLLLITSCIERNVKPVPTIGKIDSQVRKRISDLNEQINENDNPILVVGFLK